MCAKYCCKLHIAIYINGPATGLERALVNRCMCLQCIKEKNKRREHAYRMCLSVNVLKEKDLTGFLLIVSVSLELFASTKQFIKVK